VADADLLVHDVHPTEMAGQGLDWERLHALNPGLVMTSIAPFGVTGPRASWRATDLVSWCAGGVAVLNGDPAHPELPPLRAFGQQAGFQAALNAAIASLGALFARTTTGSGEHIEGSVQESVAAILELTFEFWPSWGLGGAQI